MKINVFMEVINVLYHKHVCVLVRTYKRTRTACVHLHYMSYMYPSRAVTRPGQPGRRPRASEGLRGFRKKIVPLLELTT